MKRSLFPGLTLVFCLVFFYLPLAVVVVGSFNDSRFGGDWRGFTLKYYNQLLRDREIRGALENTLVIAFWSTLTCMVLGTMAAFALHRHRSRLQFFHLSLIYSPLVAPEILMGISLLLFFGAVGADLGMTTIYLGHVTFCLSYVAMTVLGRLQDFDFSLIDAARDLGASSWTATRKILLPVIAPGIIAGGLLAFTLSLDDFVVTFFLSGAGSKTLPIYIYSSIKRGSTTKLNALSAILLVVTFLVVIISHFTAGRLDRSEKTKEAKASG
ncbi:MAG: ABC transporter permease [Planctomycetota bacterium]|jgi:spermidine/putrescine transport system permease protein|nr:ABC transporter permease [Planctomycetota bacterium]